MKSVIRIIGTFDIQRVLLPWIISVSRPNDKQDKLQLIRVDSNKKAVIIASCLAEEYAINKREEYKTLYPGKKSKKKLIPPLN